MSCKCGEDFASSANNRITIQRPAIVSDDIGGRETVWQEVATVWAVIEPMAGREVFLSSQLQSKVDAKIIVRYRADLSDTSSAAKNRVKFGSRFYSIKAVKNLSDDMKTEGKAFQHLFCTEEAS